VTIEHDDDLLLSSLAAGSSAPPGDELAGMLAAWRADIDAEPLPQLRPATESDRKPVPLPVPLPVLLPVQRRRPFRGTSGSTGPSGAGPGRPRTPRPLVVALAAAVLAFGGLAVASATAQPGTPLWPITRVLFGDTAKSRLAAQEAEKLLDQARAAIAAGDKVGAAKLVEAARVQIGQISDPEARTRLTGEADDLWGKILVMPLNGTSAAPGGGPVPGQPGQPTPTPTSGGILPPLPTISVPPLPTISLPIIG
jgi:hypothetical protein